MSDSTEARAQRLGALEDEQWIISGIDYSVKSSGSQPNSGIKSLAECLGHGRASLVLQPLAFLFLAGLLMVTLAQVSLISQDQNESRQVISEQLDQLKAELVSKIPISQGQNESMWKISEQLIQLKAELNAKIPDIRAHDYSKQEKLSQQLTQLKAQLYNLCRPCPWDWTSFAGNCYFFSMSQRNWNDAIMACQEVGAQLVIIESEEEQTFLQQTSKARGQTWMGLSDLNKEAAWLWVDDSPLASSFQKYWNKGEPNNIGEEDCAEFSGNGWNDSKCDLRKFWICKKAATPCTS